jgi:hypothetical protein
LSTRLAPTPSSVSSYSTRGGTYTVRLTKAQCLSQHLLSDAVEGAPEFVEPDRGFAPAQGDHDEQRPLIDSTS